MDYTLTLRKDAELDISAHFNFYEKKREGLGPTGHREINLCALRYITKLLNY